MNAEQKALGRTSIPQRVFFFKSANSAEWARK